MFIVYRRQQYLTFQDEERDYVYAQIPVEMRPKNHTPAPPPNKVMIAMEKRAEAFEILKDKVNWPNYAEPRQLCDYLQTVNNGAIISFILFRLIPLRSEGKDNASLWESFKDDFKKMSEEGRKILYEFSLKEDFVWYAEVLKTFTHY